MRTSWNGSISFGLVSIPVGLAPATKPAARQSDVSFRLLHRECTTPIRQKRWCPTHDREVAQDEIVRGWEVAKGQFVIVEDADLEAIERRDDSRSIEITRFVPESEVDPIYFDRTVLPRARLGAGAAPPLRAAARGDAGERTAGLGRFVRAGRERLCLVRAKGEALALETLFLAEDVYSQAEIAEAVEGPSEGAPSSSSRVRSSRASTATSSLGAAQRVPPRPAGTARSEDSRRGARGPAGARRRRRSST